MFYETLSDFGAAPKLDPPPPGWTTVALEEVTAANQEQFRVDAESANRCVDIKSFMTARVEGGVTYYVPPIGWWLWTISDKDNNYELIWVTPDGMPWLAQLRCSLDLGSIGLATAGGGGGGSGTKPPAPVKAGFPWWLALLAGGGYLAYKFAAGKKKSTKTKKRRR